MQHLQGFTLVKSQKGKQVSKFEEIIIGPKYVSFNAALRKKTKDKYIGFYVNKEKQQVVIHISAIKQSGYFSGNPYQNRTQSVLDTFHSIGIGNDVIKVIERLHYLDEHTILVTKRSGE
jgi:hypothetical protein